MKFYGAQHRIQFTRDIHGAQMTIEIAERDSAAQPQPNLAIENIEASTMAIWLDGGFAKYRGDFPAFPCRVEWRLYFGVEGCMADDDPPTGVTILKSEADMADRGGLLFQLDCRPCTTAWLCANIVSAVGGVQLQVTLRTLFWPLSGRPEVIVGTAIG